MARRQPRESGREKPISTTEAQRTQRKKDKKGMMYGLPKDHDASFLVGHTLEMICFTENTISFHFGDKIIITVEGVFSYQESKDDRDIELIEVPVKESNLMYLMGKEVSHAQCSEDGTLSLQFNNGHVLRCHDTPHYESYKIARGDEEIII